MVVVVAAGVIRLVQFGTGVVVGMLVIAIPVAVLVLFRVIKP